MFDELRDRLAWRHARKLVSRRRARPWSSPASERRVLLVLPAEERHARAAWQFVESLTLDPSNTLAVVPTGEIAFAPMSFLGRVRSLDPEQLGRLGLPKREYLREVWRFEPEVALCLMAPFELSSALLVGASPAAFRIGFFDARAEDFFDLMVASEVGVEGGMRALAEALPRVQPPLIRPSQVPSTAMVRSVWK